MLTFKRKMLHARIVNFKSDKIFVFCKLILTTIFYESTLMKNNLLSYFLNN